jgi:hypothetical protein
MQVNMGRQCLFAYFLNSFCDGELSGIDDGGVLPQSNGRQSQQLTSDARWADARERASAVLCARINVDDSLSWAVCA